MDKKYGVYICEGCGIGEALDIEKLCDVPKEEGLPVKTCPVLCGKEGVELLKSEIAEGDQHAGDCGLLAPGAV